MRFAVTSTDASRFRTKHLGDQRQSIWTIVKQIYNTTTNVPARIEAICLVQFWAWIGWFPFMFYGSTWVGEIYLRYVKSPTEPVGDALTLVGRLGSTAMIASSTISFLASIVLPWVVRNPDEASGAERFSYKSRKTTQYLGAGLVRRLRRFKPTLLNMWTGSNLMFMASMLFAPAVTSVGFATFLLALCGVPSAVNGLASGTFIGIEVNKLGSSLPSYENGGLNGDLNGGRRDSNDSIELEILPLPGGDGTSLHLLHDSSAPAAVTSTGELSGIYLGILNIYTTLPQFVGTAISWVVFSIFEPGLSPELAEGEAAKGKAAEGLSGIGVCLFIGALGAGVAAVMSRRLLKIQ